MKQCELDALADYEWYYRKKGQDGEATIFWRVIWPEGGENDTQTANFIVTLYLSAPTKQAALCEFQRWANLRMQDIPHVVLEPVGSEEIPCCPQPDLDSHGDTIADVWYRLA
jgi:hypothetical protein